MIRHIVMFRRSGALTEGQRGKAHRAFAALHEINEVADIRHGADFGCRAGNANYVSVVTIPDWDALLRYLEHTTHRHLGFAPFPSR